MQQRRSSELFDPDTAAASESDFMFRPRPFGNISEPRRKNPSRAQTDSKVKLPKMKASDLVTAFGDLNLEHLLPRKGAQTKVKTRLPVSSQTLTFNQRPIAEE